MFLCRRGFFISINVYVMCTQQIDSGEAFERRVEEVSLRHDSTLLVDVRGTPRRRPIDVELGL